MLVRSTMLAALAAATALAAGGTTATVVLSAASDKGVSASTERTEHSQAGDTHGKADQAGAEADAEQTEVTPPACPADVKSHGAYVSSVAKNKAADAEPGAHGALVSAAAKSDCGKHEGSDEAEGADDDADGTKSDKAEAGKANANEKGTAGQQLGAAHGKSSEHTPTARPAR